MSPPTATYAAPKDSAAGRRRSLAPGVRRAVLSVHVIVSVGLLGAGASLLVLAITGATAGDPGTAAAAYRFAGNAGLVLGMPLSFAALISGVIMGLGTKWGVFRYPWVTTKLALIVVVLLLGALVTGPASEHLAVHPNASPLGLIVPAAVQVLALAAATVLSIYKPGARRRLAPGAAAR